MIEINNKRLCECCFAETDSEVCPKCGFDKASYVCDPTVLPCGSILMGKYIVGRVIGKGGFGITYKAYDITANKVIAIKEYYPNGLANRTVGNPTVMVSTQKDAEIFRSGAEKFYNEARLVSKFNGNPGIVSVYEFFYENDTVYFTMEFLRGNSLKEFIDINGVINENQAVYIANCVSAALLAVHSINVLHRDVSPDNIMVCNDGTVKLIDFGAARQITAEGSQNLSVILKHGFAPLEQYQIKGKQGPWTDIYSLGASLYYAMTRETIDDPMTRMENDDNFQSNKNGISADLFEVIRKSCMLKAAERFGDIFMFKSALSEVDITPLPLVEAEVLPEENIQGHRTAQPYILTANEHTSGGVPVQEAPAENPPEAPAAVTPEAVTSEAPIEKAEEKTGAAEKAPPEQKKMTKKLGILIGAAGAALIVLIICIVLLAGGGHKRNEDDDKISTSSSAEESTTTKKAGKSKQKNSEKNKTSPKTTTAPTPEPSPTTTKKPKETEPKQSEVPSPSPKTSTSPKTSPTPSPKTSPSPSPKATPKPTPTPNNDPSKVYIGGKYYSIDSTSLNLSGKKLTNSDIKVLGKMKKLKVIDLSNNNISDLSVLKNITTLEDICANYNSVSDISFIKNLKKLKSFSMTDNKIKDISVFKNFTGLEAVWLNHNKITDISPLKNCKKLVELGLSDNGAFENISILKGMTKLEELHLGGADISDISALASCKALRNVYLYDNCITDFSALTKLKYLETVCLNNNCIFTEEIAETLYGMTIATKLELCNNSISQKLAEKICENVYSLDGTAEVYY